MKKTYVLAIPVTRFLLAAGEYFPAQLSGHQVCWATRTIQTCSNLEPGDLVPNHQVGQSFPNGVLVAEKRAHLPGGWGRPKLAVICSLHRGSKKSIETFYRDEEVPSAVIADEEVWRLVNGDGQWRPVDQSTENLLGRILVTIYPGTSTHVT